MKKQHPESVEDLVQAIKNKSDIDLRTSAGRNIKKTRKAIRQDLDGTAAVLLEKDIANCATIQSMLMKEIAANFKDSEGNLHPGLQTLLRFQSSGRSAMLALKKFKDGKKPQAKGLGDLILEQTEEEE